MTAYVDVATVDNYVASYYPQSSAIRIKWEALIEDDKSVFINRATQMINLLPLRGKACEGNEMFMAFPREPDPGNNSLELAKQACCDLSIKLNGDDEFQERLNLQRQGVKSYKLGDLSETFGNNGYDAGIDIFVYDTVFPFLRNWLSGGYKILPEKHHCGE